MQQRRARRRFDDEPENHERWLISYADFITLLFAFFDALQLRLQQAGSATVEAVAFGEGAAADSLPQQIDIAFNLELNEWQGKRSVQLRLRDWRPAT